MLEYATQPDQPARQLNELWKKNMDAIGLRIVFKIAQVAGEPEGLARRQADDVGRGLERRTPDGDSFLALGYGPNKGQANHARFDLPAFNAAVRRSSACCPTAPSARR